MLFSGPEILLIGLVACLILKPEDFYHLLKTIQSFYQQMTMHRDHLMNQLSKSKNHLDQTIEPTNQLTNNQKTSFSEQKADIEAWKNENLSDHSLSHLFKEIKHPDTNNFSKPNTQSKGIQPKAPDIKNHPPCQN